MAATDNRPVTRRFGSIVMAALALPGVAQAETAPEKGSIALKYMYYKDAQKNEAAFPGTPAPTGGTSDRVTVKVPSLRVVAPIGTEWSVEAGALMDDVSGASPRAYTAVSGATMSERRKAGDLKVTRHFSRAAVAVGVNGSKERDYESNAVGIEGRLASQDNNTVWHAGLGFARDRIGSVEDPTINGRKRTSEFLFGVTQAMTAVDLLQLNVTYRNGNGYFSDPYKAYDKRPDERRQATLQVRWNHHVQPLGATVRTGYRFYRDSFGVSAHTLDLAWAQPAGDMWTITPNLRYYSQSAADFYCDVAAAPTFPTCPGTPAFFTSDQRMSAFGAVSAGLKLEVRLNDWTGDIRYDRYVQRSDWRLGGKGSPGLDTFFADTVQLGVSKAF